MAKKGVPEIPPDPLSAGVDPAEPPLTGIEYRLLVEHSPVLIWRADVNKKCDYFNRVWLEFTGRTLEQETGDGWAEGVHPDDLGRCFQIYVTNFDARQPFEMEYRLKRYDGAYRWIFDRGVPYTDDNGEFLGYIGSCVDVTDRREAEQQKLAMAAEHAAFVAVTASEKALRQSEARERFLAHVSQVMSAHIDYQAALRALLDLMVPTLADLCFFDNAAEDGSLGRRAWKHVDTARDKWLAEKIATGVIQSSNSEATRRLRQGVAEFVPAVDDAWIEATATSPEHEKFLHELQLRSLMRIPIRDGERLVGILSLARINDDRLYTDADLNLAISIGDRLTATLRNARLYSELQQVARMRDEVTSIVSHDLRNPVHTVRMASSMLLDIGDSMDSESARKNLMVIQRSALNMSRLLDDLLDVTKSEAGGFSIEAAATDVRSIMSSTVEQFRLQAAERGIELAVAMPEALPPAHADAARVAQVLSNLTGNALKFTPQGGSVRLSATVAGDEIVVAVADTGIGIAAENVAHVFDRFWQAKRASRASAGLGLAIAKSIVEAHGGQIRVESTEGLGTTFQFTLPVETNSPQRVGSRVKSNETHFAEVRAE
ncbi:MAG TPA: PAS domain-containing sensor histidine kinase [Gemmatimonadaceae bacterium]|nr:PAS domain-containing sensor histidine kinase [Gemmatimonadaceae bacterium]